MDRHDKENEEKLTDLSESAFDEFSKSSPPESQSSSNVQSSSTTTTFGQLPSMSPFEQPKDCAKLMNYRDEDDDNEDEESKRKKMQLRQFNQNMKIDEDLCREFDEIVTDFVEKEPQLREQWQEVNEALKLTEKPEGVFDTVSGILKSVSEMAKIIKDDEREVSEEDLSRFVSKLGISADGDMEEGSFLPEIFSILYNFFQNVVLKKILYPLYKDLSDKYPAWLDEHRHELESKDSERYLKHSELMQQLCIEFEAASESESDQILLERIEKIDKIMQEMKEYGPPPKDITSNGPDMSDVGLSQLSRLTGAEAGQEQGCSLM